MLPSKSAKLLHISYTPASEQCAFSGYHTFMIGCDLLLINYDNAVWGSHFNML